jgi:hypothetical protein
MGAVGLAVGSGVGVGVAGMVVGVRRPPQAVSRRVASSRKASLVRTRILRRKMEVFYLIFLIVENYLTGDCLHNTLRGRR